MWQLVLAVTVISFGVLVFLAQHFVFLQYLSYAIDGTIALLALYHVLQIILARYHLNRPGLQGQPDFAGTPVCVQIPMYNEANVYRRAIDCACSLQYPGPLLIQIVDDSSADLRAEIANYCIMKREELRHKSLGLSMTNLQIESDNWHTIQHVTRTNRQGYKAGALNHAMENPAECPAKEADIIVLLDADFMPQKDLIEKVVPHFFDQTGERNRSVGFVQCAWGNINENWNPLTLAQTMWISNNFFLFILMRSRSNAIANFSGTAGAWSKQTILESGGWSADTVTEDADLSFRAYLAGFHGVFVPTVVVPAELPTSMATYKTQQYRWSKGWYQVFKKLISRVMSSDQLSVYAKVEALYHTFLDNLSHPLRVASIAVHSTRMWIEPDAYTTVDMIISISTISAVLAFVGSGSSFVSRFIPSTSWAGFKRCIFAIILTFGLSIHLTFALFDGLFSKDATFVRTPKTGSFINMNTADHTSTKSAPQKTKKNNVVYLPQISTSTWIEIALAIWLVVLAAFRYQHYPILSSVTLVSSFGYLWVGFGSISRKVISFYCRAACCCKSDDSAEKKFDLDVENHMPSSPSSIGSNRSEFV